MPRAEQHEYFGTDCFYGGLARDDIGGLHPAKSHRGLLDAALKAGVTVHGETAVLAQTQDGDKFTVRTARGSVQAHAVIMATNGYTDGVDTWLRRRMVPVRSRMIVTAPISGDLMRQLIPRGVMGGDTRRRSNHLRPTSDGTRVLIGGRDSAVAGEGEGAKDFLRGNLVQMFPRLSDVVLTHNWYGYAR